MAKRLIRVGSRDSVLAVRQSEIVIELLRELHPDWDFELITMKTTGDLILDRALDKIGGKGLFVKELDRALREGEVDITVHSLKDMPMETPEDLPLLAYLKREDPRDALILPEDGEMSTELPFGCGSHRRVLMLRKIYGDLCYEVIRGNVHTRIAKVERGDYSATVLAYAGLKRLGMEARASRVFSVEEIIPAAGQATIVVQGRANDDYGYLQEIDDNDTRLASLAERAFVRYLDGGCSLPIAAYAKIEGETLNMQAMYYSEATGEHAIGELAGNINEAEFIGISLAKQLKLEAENE